MLFSILLQKVQSSISLFQTFPITLIKLVTGFSGSSGFSRGFINLNSFLFNSNLQFTIFPLKSFLLNIPIMSVSIKDPLNELFSISLSGLPIVEFSNLPLNSLLFIFLPVTIIGFNSSTFLVFRSQNILFAHTIF